MPTLTAAATTELGQAGPPGSAGVDGYGVGGERTRELLWPASIGVFDAMRTADTGVRAALRAVKLPILATGWRVVRSPGVRPEVHEFVEAELGLARDTDGRLRARDGGVQWEQFLSEALCCLEFGHYPFEQVYALGAPDTPGLVTARGMAQVAHLRKLAPRPPVSLASIDVAADGGLAGVSQYVVDPRTRQSRVVRIPVERLVMFTNEREAANWQGTSVLRSAYKHWLIRDVLIRLSAISVDRTGMGLPVATYSGDRPEARREAIEVVTKVRGGEDAGVALREDVMLQLLGVTGSVVDPLPLIRYHEQASSKATLAMFLDLGHDTGARSLGETFLDTFLLGVQAVVRNIESTVTDHVVRDLVRLNFGPAEPWPVVRADAVNSDSAPTTEALTALAGAGLLGPLDAPLVTDVRRRYGLPGYVEGARAVAGAPTDAGVVDLPGGGTGVPGAPGAAGPGAGALPGTRVVGPQAVTVPGMPGTTPGTPAGAGVGRAMGAPVVAASAAPPTSPPTAPPGARRGLRDELSERVARLHATVQALALVDATDATETAGSAS